MPRRFLPHLERILVPLGKDGSAEALLNFLVCLLRNMSPDLVKKIYLAHVVSSDAVKRALQRDLRLESLFEESEFLTNLYREYLRREAEPFLSQAEERLRRDLPDLPLEKIILRGNPSRELSRLAYEKRVGAEIVARRARSHLSELLLGSTTHALIHRPGEHSTYVVGRRFAEEGYCHAPRILVCLDGSPFSQKALEEAAELSLLWEAREIVLFHVVDFLPAMEGASSPEEADRVLSEAETFVKEAGIRAPVLKKVAVGSPAEEIIAEAESGDYDLVFLGRRGLGRVEEIFLGSVSEKVLHRVVSPTLVVTNRA